MIHRYKCYLVFVLIFSMSAQGVHAAGGSFLQTLFSPKGSAVQGNEKKIPEQAKNVLAEGEKAVTDFLGKDLQDPSVLCSMLQAAPIDGLRCVGSSTVQTAKKVCTDGEPKEFTPKYILLSAAGASSLSEGSVLEKKKAGFRANGEQQSALGEQKDKKGTKDTKDATKRAQEKHTLTFECASDNKITIIHSIQSARVSTTSCPRADVARGLVLVQDTGKPRTEVAGVRVVEEDPKPHAHEWKVLCPADAKKEIEKLAKEIAQRTGPTATNVPDARGSGAGTFSPEKAAGFKAQDALKGLLGKGGIPGLGGLGKGGGGGGKGTGGASGSGGQQAPAQGLGTPVSTTSITGTTSATTQPFNQQLPELSCDVTTKNGKRAVQVVWTCPDSTSGIVRSIPASMRAAGEGVTKDVQQEERLVTGGKPSGSKVTYPTTGMKYTLRCTSGAETTRNATCDVESE